MQKRSTPTPPIVMNKIFWILAWASALFFIQACKKSNSENNIPNVTVDRVVSLGLPQYAALNSIGNSLAIDGGVKGIVVYRRSIDEFTASERACPYDPSVNAAIIDIDTSQVIGVDRNCGSKFSFADGSIIQGPASRPMKQYVCEYDATNQTVYIHNWFFLRVESRK